MENLPKKLGYWLGALPISVGELLFPRLPIPVLSSLFDVLFILSYPVLLAVPDFRKVVLPNIDIVFGDTLTKKEKRAVGIRTMRRLLKMIPLCLHYGHPKNQEKMRRDVTIVGLEHLQQALAAKKGVIALEAHFGNFMLMMMALAQTGLPYVVVTKDPRNHAVRDKYSKWKRIVHVRWIDADRRGRATREILRGLSENTVVALVADERKKRDGIVVPFFGRPALTTPGPAVLSLRTGAPIIPIFIVTRENNRHTIEIGPPLSIEKTGDQETDIYRLTEEGNRVFERYIRQYPDQWAWTNPRWKL
jgi:KDO2-lipid IV(A) lauroyltransferase